jgi:hypothetical protein
MARTTSEILQAMQASKAQQPELAGLDSTSQSAIYNLIFYITALSISIFEQILDVFKADVDKIRLDSYAATAPWWSYWMKKFQYAPGDPDRGVLVIGEDLIPKYTIVDTTKQIIKYVSVKQSTASKQLNIKVAKDVGGEPAQLNQDELAAAQYYTNEIQPAGLFINTISFPPDILSGTFDIYYNGLYVQSVVEQNVRDAIQLYLRNLPFDGTVYLLKLIDTIQNNVFGVENVVCSAISGTGDNESPHSFIEPSTQQRYVTKSGYIQVDDANLILNLILQQ